MAPSLKAVIKEGGKRGVEIEGAATMGGLEFFCTKVDEPQGDIEMLKKSVEAMNAKVDDNEEERKGGSGEIGKMIFCCNDKTLAVVAYVPEALKAKIDAKVWLDNIVAQFGGKVLGNDELMAWGECPLNEEKGLFPIKMRDDAVPKAIEYLRSKKLFPEAKEDSDSDDMIFGDDFDPDAM